MNFIFKQAYTNIQNTLARTKTSSWVKRSKGGKCIRGFYQCETADRHCLSMQADEIITDVKRYTTK